MSTSEVQTESGENTRNEKPRRERNNVLNRYGNGLETTKEEVVLRATQQNLSNGS